jgi:hypothetical protein
MVFSFLQDNKEMEHGIKIAKFGISNSLKDKSTLKFFLDLTNIFKAKLMV